ncbi:MAG: hypothetical protein U1G07_14090 [Verrucomicrobiota bacterium]
MTNLHPHILLDKPAIHPARRSIWFARLCLLTIGAAVPATSTSLAQAGSDASNCEKVSGAFSTDFIAQDQTAGTATGDLKGTLGVKILSMTGEVGNGKPVTGKAQHFWVTEAGDTIFTQELVAEFYPSASPSLSLLYALVEQEVKITGGTGRFEGATGVLKVWGAADFAAGQAVGRYTGTVCFKSSGAPSKVAVGGIQDGQFRFQVEASGDREVVAETSSNLKDWEKLAAKAPVNGVATFSDPSMITELQRFYRAKGE